MWVTIYFKTGTTIETIIHSFSDLDGHYDKKEISFIKMGCKDEKQSDNKSKNEINI